MLYLQSRSVLMAIGCAMFSVSFFSLDWISKIRFVWLAGFAAIMLIAYFVLVNPQHALVILFENLIDLFLYGYSDEYSTNVRLTQLEIAAESIRQRPWFGIGMLSFSEGIFHEVFGRVNPSDIGIVGIFMKFGFVGAFILYIQLVLVWLALLLFNARGVDKSLRAPVQTLFLMNGYLFFISIFTGSVAFSPLGTMLFVFLLIIMYSPLRKGFLLVLNPYKRGI